MVTEEPTSDGRTIADAQELSDAEARRLLRLWDEQQAAYVAYRENRFEVMLDVVRARLGDGFRVLDLACGPGAISERVLSTFSEATAVAVDYDPVLLRIARGVLGAYGDRARVCDLDLVAPGWGGVVGPVDAVLSSTALHWLSPGELLEVYRAAAELLPAGGVLLNADHLRFDDSSPALRDLSARHDALTQAAAFAGGARDYAAWYAEAARHPEIAGLVPERERRFADRPPQPLAPLEFHLAALRAAGFAEVGTVWQYLDDYVVFARR
ncbi:class I SAM-dependent methyltransferase [Actinoplanes sp. RD1]|uniref:class I SAM-dependent methyltransferase n=1 Tax=Actinoplanes sp. RD1 TaxID=3064538 RepID=UPI0027406DE1|nr:class I SAM-dependent methyltransferase [Actinoplanes sp. RD1]